MQVDQRFQFETTVLVSSCADLGTNEQFIVHLGESSGRGRSFGDAAQEAFTLELSRLAFEESGQCQMCCGRMATKFCWSIPVGERPRKKVLRCDQCSVAARGTVWEPIAAQEPEQAEHSPTPVAEPEQEAPAPIELSPLTASDLFAPIDNRPPERNSPEVVNQRRLGEQQKREALIAAGWTEHRDIYDQNILVCWENGAQWYDVHDAYEVMMTAAARQRLAEAGWQVVRGFDGLERWFHHATAHQIEVLEGGLFFHDALEAIGEGSSFVNSVRMIGEEATARRP